MCVSTGFLPDFRVAFYKQQAELFLRELFRIGWRRETVLVTVIERIYSNVDGVSTIFYTVKRRLI